MIRLPAVQTGAVVRGKQLGRRLGFPTANLLMADEGALPNGVYAATLTRRDGTVLPGVLNRGAHPTVPDGPKTVEIHLFHFDGDLYGETVTLTYLRFLRPEARFDSADEMARQVMLDIAAAKAYFQGGTP